VVEYQHDDDCADDGDEISYENCCEVVFAATDGLFDQVVH
jgi:hypothetical protein